MILDDKLYRKIVDLCNDGDDLIEDDNYNEAIVKYKAALDLVPLPKNKWEASTWIYTALGDTYFLKEDYIRASEYFYNALNCPEGISNPFVLLRLGQSLYESCEFSKAKEFLLKAFMVEGVRIFNAEDEKYLELIIDLI